MAKKAKETAPEATAAAEQPIPKAPVVAQPNKWDRKVKVTLEELMQLQMDCKLVGSYEDKGELIALIRD